MESRINIIIADDHKLFLEGLNLILSNKDDIKIVGEAVNGLQTIIMVSELKPHVVLLDITMPDMNGMEAILPIRKNSPTTKALMLTPSVSEEMIYEALKMGAKGCISKEANTSDLFKAIHAVHRGELWVERKLLSKFLDEAAGIVRSATENQQKKTREGLTPREQEVLRCLSIGCTNKEIAKKLFISEKTVKCHLYSIFRKLKINQRLQAIVYAIHQGLM